MPIDTRVCCRLAAGIVLCISMVYAAPPRIDPHLQSLAASRDRLQVLILLSQQPQGDIVRQVEDGWQTQKRAARMRFEEATRAPFSLPRDVNDALSDLDRINLGIRRGAIEEIQRTIQPQQESVALMLQSYGARNIHAYTVINAIRAEVPSTILAALEADPDIASVFPFTKLSPQLTVSVPAIQAPTFWSAHSGGTGESVGVLDSGVMSSNPGFTGVNVISRVFLAQGSVDPCFADDLTTTDHMGHGTHVGGIVGNRGGGTCPNCVGVAKGLDALYAFKIGWVVSNSQQCGGGGSAYDGDVIDAIDWAVQNTTVNVFNFSYGGQTNTDDDNTCQVFDQIGDAWGVNIVIAAGNAGAAGVESPGLSYNGVAVASMDDQGTVDRADDAISSFSSRGPTVGGRFKPDVSAPGNHGNGFGGILSTCNNGSFCNMAGTSMATPHVAGSLALIRSAGASDGLAAKAVLLNTAYNTKSGWQADSGWGFVDLAQASAQAANYFRTSVTAAQPTFYAGNVNGTLKTTLVWNRHVSGNSVLTPSFSNLDLYAYDGVTGNAIGSSTSTIQNVEQVVATGVGTAVLKVAPVSIAGVASEPYALAVSAAGFASKNGPALTVSCTGPSGSVPANTAFTVPCTVTNTGDLAAFTLSGTLNWQGVTGGTVKQFGSPGPGQQSTAQSWQITAPSADGPYTLAANVNSLSYDQTFTATTTVGVAVGPSYTLTTAVSPAGAGATSLSPPSAGGVYAAGTRVCLTATPATGWAFSSWSGGTLDSSGCLIMNANASVTANFTVPSPLLGVVETHTGSFKQGQNGVAYTVTVSNAAGAGPTSGTVTVTATLPTSMTLVSLAGTGWTCVGNTCTRNDSLTSGSSCPVLTETVNVAVNAPAQVTNQVSVSGGGSASAGASDPTTVVAVTGTGDFNGDGHTDLVWQNDATRQVTGWYMGGTDGTTLLGWNYLSGAVAGWTMVGVADFNGDGKPDLIWQNDATRQATVWYMGGAQGNTLLGWDYLSGGVAGWTIAAVADFNGDGKPDLVWQNDATRQATVWYMGGAQGTTLLGWDYLSGGVAGWKVVGAADFDGDGHPDLVWQNDATRQATVWYMGGTQGATLLGWNYLSGGVAGWKVVGP